MFHNVLKLTVLALTTVSAQKSPCPAQQQTLQSSAGQWPKPTGDLSGYISSYSAAHTGVFSNCQDFTSTMPTSLSSPYQAWVTSVHDWSVSFDSTVSAAASTCLALVANVVIPLPRCPGDSVDTGGSSAGATNSFSSSAASNTGSATIDSSGAISLDGTSSPLFFALMVCAGVIGALAIAL